MKTKENKLQGATRLQLRNSDVVFLYDLLLGTDLTEYGTELRLKFYKALSVAVPSLKTYDENFYSDIRNIYLKK